jgi:hypothetical protein
MNCSKFMQCSARYVAVPVDCNEALAVLQKTGMHHKV